MANAAQEAAAIITTTTTTTVRATATATIPPTPTKLPKYSGRRREAIEKFIEYEAHFLIDLLKKERIRIFRGTTTVEPLTATTRIQFLEIIEQRCEGCNHGFVGRVSISPVKEDTEEKNYTYWMAVKAKQFGR